MKHFIINLSVIVLLGTGASVAKAQGAFGPRNSGSSTDADTGVTTTSQLNADGSRTVTKTDANGKVISTEKIQPVKPGVRPVRRPRIPLGGSTTWKGETIVVVINADGSRTIIKSDGDGKETGRSNSKDEPVTKAGPKPAVGGSTTDPWTGETTSVERNADGSRKITKTDADGKKSPVETTSAPREEAAKRELPKETKKK